MNAKCLLSYLQEYEVKQFYLIFDYVENLRNLVDLKLYKGEVLLQKSPITLFFASRHQFFISTFYFNFNLKKNFS